MKDELKLLIEKKKPLKFVESVKERLNELHAQTHEFKKMQVADKLFSEMASNFRKEITESVADLTKTQPHPLGYKGVKRSSYFTNHYKMLDNHYSKMEIVDPPPESYGIVEFDVDDMVDYTDDEIEDFEKALSDEDFIDFDDEELTESVIDDINMAVKNKEAVEVTLNSGQTIEVAPEDAAVITRAIQKLEAKKRSDFINTLSKDARSFFKALHSAKARNK